MWTPLLGAACLLVTATVVAVAALATRLVHRGAPPKHGMRCRRNPAQARTVGEIRQRIAREQARARQARPRRIVVIRRHPPTEERGG